MESRPPRIRLPSFMSLATRRREVVLRLTDVQLADTPGALITEMSRAICQIIATSPRDSIVCNVRCFTFYVSHQLLSSTFVALEPSASRNRQWAWITLKPGVEIPEVVATALQSLSEIVIRYGTIGAYTLSERMPAQMSKPELRTS
jgi:hypothetical protein